MYFKHSYKNLFSKNSVCISLTTLIDNTSNQRKMICNNYQSNRLTATSLDEMRTRK